MNAMNAGEIRLVQGPQLRFSRPEGSAHLRTEIEGDRCVLSTRVKRAFPRSEPDRYLSIQDAGNHEIVLLRSVEGMDAASRALLTEELDRRYFTPTIQGIEKLRQEGGMWFFVVRTQRGSAEFYVQNWRDSAFEVAPRQWQITSVDGQRYGIADLEALDRKSQALLDQLL